MSTENQVPAVAEGHSTALTPAATEVAAVQRPEGTASGQQTSTPAPISDFATSPALHDLVEDMMMDVLINGAYEQADRDRIFRKLAPYAPQFERALRSRDIAKVKGLAEQFKQQLLDEGESADRIRWAEEALAHSNDRARQILSGSSEVPASPALVDEMRELNQHIADPRSPYWYSGPDPKRRAQAERLQARWRELYDSGVRGDALAPISIEKIDARIEQIEALMRKPNSDYHRGPNAALIQREYRELIDQKQHAMRRS